MLKKKLATAYHVLKAEGPTGVIKVKGGKIRWIPSSLLFQLVDRYPLWQYIKQHEYQEESWPGEAI